MSAIDPGCCAYMVHAPLLFEVVLLPTPVLLLLLADILPCVSRKAC